MKPFRHAWTGIAYAFASQRNLRVHAGIALAVVVAARLAGVSRGAWLAIVLAIALVVSLEVFNTALEAAVDLASPAEHPLARIAKDCAAGAVLVAAVGAVVVGLLAFLGR